MYQQDTTTIRVSRTTYKQLQQLGTLGDTFDSLIQRLILNQKNISIGSIAES